MKMKRMRMKMKRMMRKKMMRMGTPLRMVGTPPSPAARMRARMEMRWGGWGMAGGVGWHTARTAPW